MGSPCLPVARFDVSAKLFHQVEDFLEFSLKFGDKLTQEVFGLIVDGLGGKVPELGEILRVFFRHVFFLPWEIRGNLDQILGDVFPTKIFPVVTKRKPLPLALVFSTRREFCPKGPKSDIFGILCSMSQITRTASFLKEPLMVGDYVLGRTLGQGSYGVVKMATHIRTKQKVLG